MMIYQTLDFSILNNNLQRFAWSVLFIFWKPLSSQKDEPENLTLFQISKQSNYHI